jgi:hypothetical protein
MTESGIDTDYDARQDQKQSNAIINGRRQLTRRRITADPAAYEGRNRVCLPFVER